MDIGELIKKGKDQDKRYRIKRWEKIRDVKYNK